MEVISLKCPNCGALVPKETMKCDYCGADVILSPNGYLASEVTVLCPKCSFKNAKGSWFCMNCGNVITRDIFYLRQIQKRIKFKQNKFHQNLPQKLIKVFNLSEDEFILHAYLGPAYNWGIDEAYVVTEKRFISFFWKPGVKIFGGAREIFWEASWDEIATVSEPITSGLVSTKIIFTTFDDKEKEIWVSSEVGIDIFRECMNAMDNFLHQRVDARAKLYRLSLGT